ncbi:ABC transporter ATP-binding protein [Massilia sp. GCM10020059]|nr:Wzt carbohydrate-binding domain-containing protein [Massilia agrisoli]
MGSIHVAGLGKAYKQYPTRWSRLAEWMLPFRGPRHKLKWVLQDINFAIAAGEAIGIIGINGAGKSTLLKLITGTTQASAGAIRTSGRIAALLELGMGFHPDVTGRNNIVMAGQLMGLTMDEIAALMPEIIAFAEIGEHIDAPVRVYSSGMQMRLAFSVATCVRPDILIVDEALAVGDVFFQQKCFERIRQFTEAGTTLLFVSHSTGTVLKTCTRCLFIENGALAFDGAPKEAIDLYQAALLGRQDRAGHAFQVTAPGVAAHMEAARERHAFLVRDAVPLDGKAGSIRTGRAECVGARFVDAGGADQLTLVADSPATLELEFRIDEELDDPHAGFKIRDRFGVVLFETNTYCMRAHLGAAAAGSILAVRFAFALSLRPDEYTITVGLANGGYGDGQFREVICYLHEVTALAVLPNPAAITWAGAVNLSPQLSFEKY